MNKKDSEDFEFNKSVFKNVDVVIHTAGLNAKECLNNPTKATEINGFSILAEVGKLPQIILKR